MDSDRLAGFGSAPASTLYDVAREAGVSTATVSRVVHGQDRVRPSTRRRVLEVIEALGYIPDGAAQSLAQRRKEVVGLVAIESRGPETDIERDGLLVHRRGAARRRALAGRDRMVGADLLPARRRPGGRLPADAEDLRQGRRDAHRRGHRRLGAAGAAGGAHPDRADRRLSRRAARRRHRRRQPIGHESGGLPYGRAARQDQAVLHRGPGGSPGRAGTAQRVRRGGSRAPGGDR